MLLPVKNGRLILTCKCTSYTQVYQHWLLLNIGVNFLLVEFILALADVAQNCLLMVFEFLWRLVTSCHDIPP